jgi:Vacuole effluxer Atg22 like
MVLDRGVMPKRCMLPVCTVLLLSLTYSIQSLQATLNAAGFQPGTHPPKPCTDSSPCVVPWIGGTRAVSSVVLIANGSSFTISSALFLWLGSAADYDGFDRWLLLALTVVCWVSQYGLMAIRSPSQWPAVTVMYAVGFIAYGTTLVFYAAIFPKLARYMPHVRKAREEDLKEGRISQETYNAIESMEKNHICNISTAHSNIGTARKLIVTRRSIVLGYR